MSFWGRLAVGSLALDVAFVLAHQAHVRGIEPFGGDRNWLLNLDGSYPEMFGYGKLAVAGVLLVVVARRGPKLLYLTWSLVMLVMVIDDAAQLHERAGRSIATTLDLSGAFGLRGQDLGELIFWAVVGTLLLALLAIAHVGITTTDRWRSAGLFGCLLLLGFFGIIVDMVHVLLSNRDRARRIAIIIEDGGELMALSILLVYVVWLLTLTTQAASIEAKVLPARNSRRSLV